MKTAGGAITFDCGGKHTITVASRLIVGSAKDKTVIIDGQGLITISGGGKTRVFDLDNYTNFVVQRLAIVDGFVAAGEPKEANKPQNSGAAIRHPWFGTLKAIDVRFEHNRCASLDGEIGGGAIYAGGLTEAVLSGCEFIGNEASNGGGILNQPAVAEDQGERLGGSALRGGDHLRRSAALAARRQRRSITDLRARGWQPGDRRRDGVPVDGPAGSAPLFTAPLGSLRGPAVASPALARAGGSR